MKIVDKLDHNHLLQWCLVDENRRHNVGPDQLKIHISHSIIISTTVKLVEISMGAHACVLDSTVVLLYTTIGSVLFCMKKIKMSEVSSSTVFVLFVLSTFS